LCPRLPSILNSSIHASIEKAIDFNLCLSAAFVAALGQPYSPK
jgi:hypothetical protein